MTECRQLIVPDSHGDARVKRLINACKRWFLMGHMRRVGLWIGTEDFYDN